MRRFAALLLLVLAFAASPAAGQVLAYADVSSLDAGVEAAGIPLEPSAGPAGKQKGGERLLAASGLPEPSGMPRVVASFGPFRVLDDNRAALVDVTGTDSPAQFAAMLRAHPGIRLIELIDCPGTEDDLANLRLGRMIRAGGIVTRVPRGGSVRSGGVELFLAGARRIAAADAEFAVHAWMDEDGREAGDYAMSAPENAKYLAYYRAMGMSEAQASAFYAMTNSAPHARARWLDTAELARWVSLEAA